MIKIAGTAGSYEDKLSLYENWDVGFLLFLSHPFLETMLLSESLITRIFFETYFDFKKLMEEI